jgi:hypothetical protein
MKYSVIFIFSIVVMSIWLVRYGFMKSMSYDDHLFHREEEYKTSKDYIDAYCTAKEHIKHKNIADGCHKHAHIVNINPTMGAIKDVLDEIGWWGPFGEIAQEIIIIIGFTRVVFIFCIISIGIGIWIALSITQRDIKRSSENDTLPYLTTGVTMSSNPNIITSIIHKLYDICSSSINYVYSRLSNHEKIKKKKE